MPLDKQSEAKEALEIINDLEFYSSRLSDWEITFLDSLKSQIGGGRKLLTENQTNQLDRIYQRIAR